MKTAYDPRHQHRVNVMQHLYSAQFQHKPDGIIANIWDQLEKIDPLINLAAPEWPIDKLNPIDLAILRQAVYELTIDKNVPFKVIIDEAIELAKEFGSSNSASFINGALGKLVTELKIEIKDEPQS
jgi:transcription antitermination factor NusB